MQDMFAVGAGAGKTDTVKAWLQAARVPFLVAALLPPFLGFVLAGKDTGVWKTGQLLLVLLGCVGIQVATNLANDYFDHLQGVDENSIGGSRAIQEGKISLSQYRLALALLYSGCFLLGLVGAWYTGHWGILALMVFGIFSSLFYVGPPIRYGYHAFGEVMVFLSMGIGMTAGTYYALTGYWGFRAISLAIPVGLLVAGILYFQSLPEIFTDREAGKFTLSNTLGPKRAVFLLRIWWPLVWLLMIVPCITGTYSWLVLAGIALSIPMYCKVIGPVQKTLEKNGDWLALDGLGHYVRKMYALGMFAMILALAVM